MSNGAVLRLQWAPGHRDITGNEKADSAAKKAAKMIGPIKKPQIRYLSAVYSTLVQPLVNQIWKARWAKSLKGRHLFHLTPEPTRATHKLYTGAPKAHNALITQLRTGKIGFNAFLHKRKVPGFDHPRSACDLGTMTVRHVLLSCLRWRDLRLQHLAQFKTSDTHQLLNTLDEVKAAA